MASAADIAGWGFGDDGDDDDGAVAGVSPVKKKPQQQQQPMLKLDVEREGFRRRRVEYYDVEDDEEIDDVEEEEEEPAEDAANSSWASFDGRGVASPKKQPTKQRQRTTVVQQQQQQTVLLKSPARGPVDAAVCAWLSGSAAQQLVLGVPVAASGRADGVFRFGGRAMRCRLETSSQQQLEARDGARWVPIAAYAERFAPVELRRARALASALPGISAISAMMLH